MPLADPAPDAFHALAEPRRRRLLMLLAEQGDRPVGDLVAALGWSQPLVSKHLAVLREAGLVRVTREGRQRLYAIRPEELNAVHDWLSTVERMVTGQAERIRRRAQAAARTDLSPPPPPPETAP